jgi:hypothetical protein
MLLGELSDFITTIEHLEIILVLIICITTCIAHDRHNKDFTCHCLLPPPTPPPPPFGSAARAQVYIMSIFILFSSVYHFLLTVYFMSFSFSILHPVMMEDQVHIRTRSLWDVAAAIPTIQATTTICELWSLTMWIMCDVMTLSMALLLCLWIMCLWFYMFVIVYDTTYVIMFSIFFLKKKLNFHQLQSAMVSWWKLT